MTIAISSIQIIIQVQVNICENGFNEERSFFVHESYLEKWTFGATICVKKCWFLADTLSVFQGERDLGDKDKSVDLQLSPYQSMRRLGSKGLK